jgi:hypothetical protein
LLPFPPLPPLPLPFLLDFLLDFDDLLLLLSVVGLMVGTTTADGDIDTEGPLG